MTSNAAKCSRSCIGVTMPAWCVAVEGIGTRPRVWAGGRRRPRGWSRANPPAAPPRRRPARHRPRPEARAATRADAVPAGSVEARAPSGDFDGLGRSRGRSVRPSQITAAASLDSGSDSAFTASDSCLDLAAAQLVVVHEARPRTWWLVQQHLQRDELRVDLGVQRGVALLQQRPQPVEADPGAVDVGLEVPQVGPRPVLLLAGDLAGGDLVQQAAGAVGDLVGGEGQVPGLARRGSRCWPSGRRRTWPGPRRSAACSSWPGPATGPSRSGASR